MSIDRAVVATSPGGATLRRFNDEIVVKMELVDEGFWILLARVTLLNGDSDPQDATAKLIYDANVLIHQETNYIDYLDPICIYFQVGFTNRGKGTIVTLECNTYEGVGQHASIVALKVDDIDFQ